MPEIKFNNRVFDARPDRIDYRDRSYNPPLVNLPKEYPDPQAITDHLHDYTERHGLILDQGKEGACTGFGLAAVINYLLWRIALDPSSGRAKTKIVRVSPRMLYNLAQLYDEWPGEDYVGSSCRGAMKGWHKHGVCSEEQWPYLPEKYIKPKKNWQTDAAHRPLGAYYRINKDSIADMQAAIREVGAIYVSALVHEGWFLSKKPKLSLIPLKSEQAGGHAFAMIGYTSKGFIVQNSWGQDWGYLGFAIMTYGDWVQHGTDAWVSVIGAPMEVQPVSRTLSSLSHEDRAAGKAEWFWSSESITRGYQYRNKAVEPLSEEAAYEHTVVMGNNGQPIDRFVDTEDNADAVAEVVYTLPLDWLRQQQKPKLAVYAHGGLNDEEASIKRIRVMAPYFRANGIYPLFITWRTGFGDSLVGILEDSVKRFFVPVEGIPVSGWMDNIKKRVKDGWDRSVEVACEQLLVKSIWMQMKQNAAAAKEAGAGLVLITQQLTRLRKDIPNIELHLIGHSAGSILHGHLLDKLAEANFNVKTCSLYAPACTVDFALEHYKGAVDKKILSWESIHVDMLSDKREQADTVGPYGKSLLYLVSRALEDVHKMPLLGMEAAWHKEVEDKDMWAKNKGEAVEKWRKDAKNTSLQVHGKNRKDGSKVWDGQEYIPLAHGSFDNDIEVITATLKRIIGSNLKAKVENLKGF